MKKLSIMVLALFLTCLSAIPSRSDAQQKSQKDQNTEQVNSESGEGTKNVPETVPEGRKVILKDGREIVVVDVPDSLMKETRVHFDEEGKAHVSCH